MKSRHQPWRKRILFILVGVTLSIVAALFMQSLDGPYVGEPEENLPSQRTPTPETLEAFRLGTEQMSVGDYDSAITTYEEQLSRLTEVPIDHMSSYFGDLGLAHYYQGQHLQEAGRSSDAQHHFERAALMFEQAAETATHGLFVSVADFYRLLALFSAKEYAEARTVGEAFLEGYPEAAVAAELLPEGVVATVKEILTVSYISLAEERGEAEATAVLRANALRYAEEAIAESPERVIQPYLFTGLNAYDRGDRTTAVSRLQTYLRLMQEIPEEHWHADDVDSVRETRSILSTLGSPLP